MSKDTTQSDNLAAHISRLYLDPREFTNDQGELVKYTKPVLEVLVNGEPFPIDLTLEKKDIAIIKLSDIVAEGFED